MEAEQETNICFGCVKYFMTVRDQGSALQCQSCLTDVEVSSCGFPGGSEWQ